MPTPLPTRPSVRVQMEVHRGSSTVVTGNRWFLDKTDNDFQFAQWEQLFDKFVELYDVSLDAAHTLVSLDAYNAGSDVIVQSRGVQHVCSAVWSDGVHAPSDCAAVLRFRTDGRTSRNHPIYLFKYFHAIKFSASINSDLLTQAVVDSMNLMGDNALAGFEAENVTYSLCGPFGHVATNRECLPEVRHRDFPR